MKKLQVACIIDDDAIAIFGMKRSLMSVSCDIDLLVYENGYDAFVAIKEKLEAGEEIPSPLFVDLNMPVMDGWDFIKEMRNLLPKEAERPEMYIMTSSIDVKDMERAKKIDLGSNYLIKPVAPEVFEGLLCK